MLCGSFSSLLVLPYATLLVFPFKKSINKNCPSVSVLAKYAFGLAQSFNGFYHKYSILNEEREDVRIWRAAAVAYYRAQLTRALDLMGCAVPAKM